MAGVRRRRRRGPSRSALRRSAASVMSHRLLNAESSSAPERAVDALVEPFPLNPEPCGVAEPVLRLPSRYAAFWNKHRELPPHTRPAAPARPNARRRRQYRLLCPTTRLLISFHLPVGVPRSVGLGLHCVCRVVCKRGKRVWKAQCWLHCVNCTNENCWPERYSPQASRGPLETAQGVPQVYSRHAACQQADMLMSTPPCTCRVAAADLAAQASFCGSRPFNHPPNAIRVTLRSVCAVYQPGSALRRAIPPPRQR